MATVAITGHTSGLGQALLGHFQQQGHQVLGFSRSNGYDIRDPAAQDRIVEQAQTADIFVNNAYHDYDDSQLRLLEKVFASWHGTDRVIINISSRFTQGNNAYCRTKQLQDDFCQSKVYQKPHILNVKPGLIDTPRVRDQAGNKMSTAQAISIIDYSLNNGVHAITFGV